MTSCNPLDHCSLHFDIGVNPEVDPGATGCIVELATNDIWKSVIIVLFTEAGSYRLSLKFC